MQSDSDSKLSDSSNSVETSIPFPEITCSTDPSDWFPINTATISFWLKQGPHSCTNESPANNYPASVRHYKPTTREPKGRTRSFSSRHFYSSAPNGQSQSRKWLLYSPSRGSVYCFHCTLMSANKDAFSQPSGFSSWQLAGKKIKTHEQSARHKESVLAVCTRKNVLAGVDQGLQQQVQEEKQYWINVLRRVVAVVKFLAQRGMSFRGDDELLGSIHNGNFLGIMELIAQFDPFLENHLKDYGNAGRGNPSYISSTIVEELIELMADQVRTTIVSELKEAKYFSVSVDSTPDLSHVDQLTVIVRYLLHGKAVERFLSFLQLESHTAENLASNLLTYFETQKIDFMDCRGQSYDNASNMSGRYSGMQARLRAINPLAFYVPCTAHSLNLVGLSAVDCCTDAVSFFGFVQALYNFFSASTHRWSILSDCLGPKGLTVKSLSDTRWSARADAVKALCDGYDSIKSALFEIGSDSQQNGMTRHEANSLASSMDSLEIGFLSDFWNRLLCRYNDTSTKLQSSTCDLKLAVDLLESLLRFTDDLRNRFDDIELRAIDISGASEYASVAARRRKRTRRFDDGQAADTVLQGKDKFRIETFIVIINQLVSSLRQRIDAYRAVHDVFKVVTDFNEIDTDHIREYAVSMANTFTKDLQSAEFADEMIQFVDFAKSRDCQTPSSLAILLYKEDLQSTFPNVEIAVRMYMSVMVSNCSGERSFSKMALIKNKLRSTMRDRRLSALELLSVENDVLESVSFEDIIEQFAAAKSRKRL